MIGGPPPQPPMGQPPLQITATPPVTKPWKSPLERIPEKDRHRLEKIVLAVLEGIRHRKKLVRDMMIAPDGRTAFEIPLTAEEQMTNYLDMQKRAQIINGIVAREGLAGVRDYLDHVAGQAENG